MDRYVFFKWLKINLLLFAGAFIVALIAALIFPDAMLSFARRWGSFPLALSETISEPVSREGLFANILIVNSFTTLLKFAASLIFLAPLFSLVSGVFYSLGLFSAIERGIEPVWHSPVLIVVETTFSLLAMSFGSALASEIFGTKPQIRGVINFWKKNWNKLSPVQEKKWNLVFGENKREIAVVIAIVFALIVVGAWIEAGV
jgi:hypothetical protein